MYSTHKILHPFLGLLTLLMFPFFTTKAQKASIREETISIKTYPFSDPNPVPVLTTNPKIYPYHTFEGYSHTGRKQPWKVVTLENDYIQLFVLPEAGGKIWGAIEKSTGEEFIYRNEVMKFRNIAMRGPWTSGGIEFNFGIIGHAPTTATPVDYVIQEHPDGSVSCIVGAMDLPSRTQWRVTITLPPDKAYFETQCVWYNPTPLHHPYYQWMTAAAEARPDLQFFFPGHAYLEHSGEANPWPVDEQGRDLSFYQHNNFGPSKSYHVVGHRHQYFGGYWQEKKFGFGHWAHYDDMPGQKLWIWALSRSGGIWEDLLTDTDGQYIEFQAGRLFNQYSYAANQHNPVSEVAFAPHATDQWREIWFPFKDIGGLRAVSPLGALNLTDNGQEVTLHFNAFQAVNDTLSVKTHDTLLYQQVLSMSPMDVDTAHFSLPAANTTFQVILGKEILYADSLQKTLKRPFKRTAVIQRSPADQLYEEGMALSKGRLYQQAMEKWVACLEKDAAHPRARLALAELFYRNAQYSEALTQIQRALEADTYDFEANYLAGITYRALGDPLNALEALGWAARSMTYRSAAYAQMAAIFLERQQRKQAEEYARRSLDYNRYNVNAYQTLAVVYRKNDEPEKAHSVLSELLALDPLHHFARYEQYLLDPQPAQLEQFTSLIRQEMPYQTYLELAMNYLSLGQQQEALRILQQSPAHPLADLWLAYLTRSEKTTSDTYLNSAVQKSADFVFPYRQETLRMLAWAVQQQPHWKIRYYLGLNYWGLHRPEEAADYLKACGEEPEYAPFYLARAELLKKTENKDPEPDIRKALSLDKEQWRAWHWLLQYLNQNQLHEKEITTAQQAYQQFPDHYVIGMDYAQALLNQGQYEACINLLQKIQVLPYEGASEGRSIYERAHLLRSVAQIQQKNYKDAIKTLQTSLEWPENLGVGKPYDPDNRKQDYLLAYCYQKSKQPKKADQHLQNLMQYSLKNGPSAQWNDLLSLIAYKRQGKQDAVSALTDTLKKAETPAAQWIMAYWEQDEPQRQTLEKQWANHKDFALLQRILSTTKDF